MSHNAENIRNNTFFVKLFEFDFFHVVRLCDCVRVFRCHTKKISVARITQFHGIEKTSMAKMTRSANHDHEALNFFFSDFCPCEFLVSLPLCCFRFVAASRGRFFKGSLVEQLALYFETSMMEHNILRLEDSYDDRNVDNDSTKPLREMWYCVDYV